MKKSVLFYLSMFSLVISLGGQPTTNVMTQGLLPTSNLGILQQRTAHEKLIWSGWKERYHIDLSKGSIIKDLYSGQILAENSGHALLLAVQFNDQSFFDIILSGLSYFINAHGLHTWQISEQGTQFSDVSSLTAAETIILLSLLQANELTNKGLWTQREPTYKTIADDLENKIWTHEIFQQSELLLRLPTDEKRNPYWPISKKESFFGTRIEIAWAPPDFSPAYYKIFAQVYPRHSWTTLIDQEYDLISTALKQSQELLASNENIKGTLPIPAWAWAGFNANDNKLSLHNFFSGNSYSETEYSNEFSSIRVPLNIGIDALWNKDSRAMNILDKFTKQANVTTVYTAYVGAEPKRPQGYNNLLAISQFGIAKKFVNQEKPFKKYLEDSLNTRNGLLGCCPKYLVNQTLTLYSYLILHDRFIKIIP